VGPINWLFKVTWEILTVHAAYGLIGRGITLIFLIRYRVCFRKFVDLILNLTVYQASKLVTKENVIKEVSITV
jgi:hypothetical protein